LADVWLQSAGLRCNEQTESVYQKIQKVLEDGIEKYRGLILKVSQRYEEDIPTLPKAFRAPGSADTQECKVERQIDYVIMRNNEKEYTDLPRVSRTYRIAYNRHALLDGEYSEAISGAQSSFQAYSQVINSSVKTPQFLQLLENSFLRFLIIDERFAEHQHDRSDVYEKLRISTAYSVTLGEDEAARKKNQVTIVDNKESETLWLSSSSKELVDENYQVLIIHQGVLDKLFEKNRRKESGKRLLRDLATIIPVIVVTSGRGEPDDVPEGTLFLPFSNIEASLLSSSPEKLRLTKNVMQLKSKRSRGA